MSNVTVLYHHPCLDGFGSAYAAWKKFGSSATYIGVTHGEPPPNVDGQIVYMLDFSYQKPILLDMGKRAERLVIIDHHKSAQEELSDLPDAHFDMSKSGAILSWEYFHGDVPPPQLLLHIQDRDLWQWQIPRSKEINAALIDKQSSFEEWDRVNLDSLYELGSRILADQEHEVNELMRQTTVVQCLGYEVAMVRTSRHISELGNALAVFYPFAIIYDQLNNGQYRYSLRSKAENSAHVDVSNVAKTFLKLGLATDAGGHKHAAGFVAPNVIEFGHLNKHGLKKDS